MDGEAVATADGEADRNVGDEGEAVAFPLGMMLEYSFCGASTGRSKSVPPASV